MQKLVFGMMAVSILAVAAPPLARAEIAGAKAEVRLAAPVSEPRKVVVDGRAWLCEVDVCKSSGQSYGEALKRECAHVVKLVGPVTSYRDGGRELKGEALANCNRNAPATEVSLKP